ncbi:hypothetical protein D3C84_1300770 [compost metagenome]
MAGRFDHPGLDITEQALQFASRGHRQQAIGAGEQVQLRAVEALQGGAGIQRGQHIQPRQQLRGWSNRGTAEQ